MSIEIILHPKAASRDNLARLLRTLGYRPCDHLWEWPKGALNFHWFDTTDYLSFDGVEATIYKPSSENYGLGPCAWALHTRTRASASPADRDQQDETIRIARAQFGGDFYNDCHGRNRYTREEPDGRDAVARGIYLAYSGVHHYINALRFTTPTPIAFFENVQETSLEVLSQCDPTRILYNALVPFALTSIEYFFSRCFKILLHYDDKLKDKVQQQSLKRIRKIEIALKDGTDSLENIVATWYSFQNISLIHNAYSEWLNIDFRGIIGRRKKIGRTMPLLEERLNYIIKYRHGVIHRMEVDFDLTRSQVDNIFAATLAIIDVFVEYLEKHRGIPIRDH